MKKGIEILSLKGLLALTIIQYCAVEGMHRRGRGSDLLGNGQQRASTCCFPTSAPVVIRKRTDHMPQPIGYDAEIQQVRRRAAADLGSLRVSMANAGVDSSAGWFIEADIEDQAARRIQEIKRKRVYEETMARFEYEQREANHQSQQRRFDIRKEKAERQYQSLARMLGLPR